VANINEEADMTEDLDRTTTLEHEDDVALVDRMRDGRETIIREIRKLIVGQDEVVDQVLLTLFVGGNSLLLGVPGLAKTLLIHTVAEVLDLNFSRIQFTPDLMPSDITGTDIIQEDAETGTRHLKFEPGPIFANIVLADEINRTPPKTQAALLEAMQEHTVTVQGTTYVLEQPFYVFATQNPIELEGTYPLPEAQLDRFMFKILLDHLTEDEELQVVRQTTGIQDPQFNRAVSGPDLVAFQRLVRRMAAPDPVLQYAVALTRASRPSPNGDSPDFVKKWVAYGASVRAAQYLILGAKARALTAGRYTPGFDDIRALAHPVLRHRILTNFHAESEGVTTGELVDQLLEFVPVPSSGM
jgi:MoxR-like ATPase